jgi:hypothetical protein
VPKDTQISAYISDSTRQRLDMFVRETGLKKGRVIEDALTYHLDALTELPADAIVPTRIVISDETAEEIAKLEAEAPRPTAALRRLMNGRP